MRKFSHSHSRLLILVTDFNFQIPITQQQKQLARRLVTCMDESRETFYVTVWGDIAGQVAQLKPGTNNKGIYL